MLTVPVPEFSVNRNLPSALRARSIFVLPVGLVPTIVPGKAVRVPVEPMAKPETVALPAFDVYRKRPSGVTTCQQVAAPRVGTLLLMGERLPLACTQ
jgi:hypothetical protein